MRYTTIIDGKTIAEKKKERLKEEISRIVKNYGRPPSLRLISVGDDSAAAAYVRSKKKYGEKLGATVEVTSLNANTTAEQLAEIIKRFSGDSETDGIVLEAPLPNGMDHKNIAQNIAPDKDVDCITTVNQGSITLNREFLLPATASAIRTIIELQNPDRGAAVTIINRSPVIGRPLSMMLLNRDFTVTICHSKTGNIRELSRRSDFVVVGVGKPRFLNDEYVSEKTTVIDAGINYVDGAIVGDADFESLVGKVKAITPVPGGVGPVTTASIFENLVLATETRLKNFVR